MLSTHFCSFYVEKLLFCQEKRGKNIKNDTKSEKKRQNVIELRYLFVTLHP